MRDRLAKIGSWGRKALVLGALALAPVLGTAPAAEARPVASVMPAMLLDAAPLEATPVQYYGRPRRYYGGRRYYRPPPRYYARRGYGPPRGYYRGYRRGYR